MRGGQGGHQWGGQGAARVLGGVMPQAVMAGAKIGTKPMGQLDAPAPGLFRSVLLVSNGYLGAKRPFIRSALPARSL